MKKMIALMISITIAVAAILDGYFLFFHTSKARRNQQLQVQLTTQLIPLVQVVALVVER